MSAALGLFRLQQVDRQLDQSNARISAIREIMGNDAELRDVLGRVEQANEKKKATQQLLNESEELVGTQQIKIEQVESSLYGGNIHNPKELQDLQSDVASLKRYLTTLEERELEAMLSMDTVQEELRTAEAALARIQTQRGDHHRQLIEEQATLMRNVERLQAERQAAISDLAAQTLEMYEGLRSRRRGIAVAEVSDGACEACGTNLTAALQQSARSTSQVVFCPSCGRILYAS
jgi:uncharacterized protein